MPVADARRDARVPRLGPRKRLADPGTRDNARSTGMNQTTGKTSVIYARAAASLNAYRRLDNTVDLFEALEKAQALNARLKAEVKRQSSSGKLKMLLKRKTTQQVCTWLRIYFVFVSAKWKGRICRL